MSDFIYLYRLPANSPYGPDSPAQLEERLRKWTVWLKDLEAKGHMKSRGHPLRSTGSTVKDKRGTVHDGPYAEAKDIVVGYAIVRAQDQAQADALTAGCPVFDIGGSVEVRPILQM
jgi:hypothetical protein